MRRKPLYLQLTTLNDGMAWRDMRCDRAGLNVARSKVRSSHLMMDISQLPSS
jgi:hypothetical protein